MIIPGRNPLRLDRLLGLFLIVNMVSAALPSFALSQKQLVFDHLTVKQGLSQSSVMCILQDRHGFMWFGTQDGLNRFDGYEIKVFRHDPADTKSVSDNFIVLIAEDREGTLWIGTLNTPDVLNRYDPLQETFTQVPKDSVDLSSAVKNAAFTSYLDPSGVLWSGKIRGGLTRLDKKTGSKKVYKHDALNPKSLSDDNVYSVFGDHEGVLWIGTKGGLDRYEPSTETFVHYRNEAKNPASININWIWPIYEDRDGALWVGTFGGGLDKFDRKTGKFTHYRNDPANPRSLSDDRLYSIYQDRSGLIWVGTADHGVDRFMPAGGSFDHIVHNAADQRSLVDNTINGMLADRSGMIWIGTNGGLEKYDRSSGVFQHFVHQPANPRSIGDNRIQSVAEDRFGDIWVGFVASGLDRYDKKSGSFVHYKHDPSNQKSLGDDRVYALLEDRSGTLWVGTYVGGLNRFDRATGTFTVFAHSDSLPSSFGGRGVWALHEDRGGNLWVGTYGGGLDRMDRANGSFVHFTHDEKNSRSLSDDNVTCIYEDRAGVLWVGTGAGLNRLDRASGTFRQYHQKDGLPNDMILGILEDGQGNLWLSTNKGISRLDEKRETFRNYDYSDGLQGDEFSQNAYARSPVTGEMYFGGTNGFNVFHPDNVKNNPFVPPVVLSSFTRYNTDDAEGRPIEEKGITAKSRITLSYKDNVATFQFAALSYYNPARNQYAYKLEGYSDSWIQLGRERKATFTNLDGGEYVLRVRGSNNDGTWNEQGTALTVVVTPPWWKTRWAYGAYTVLVFGFFFTLRRFELNRREQKSMIRESELRAKAMEAEKRALEAENERQTKELEDARKLQLSLLPKDVPQMPGFDIAVFMKTATEVGGDYYDFNLGDDQTLDIAFGDATGHGMQAGTIVTLMKGLFLSDASRIDILSFFGHCSKALKEIRLGRLFMAFTLVRLRGKSVYLSSAGMPPVFVFRRKESTIEEIFLKGMPLGAMKKFPYVLHETSLESGDTLLLLSDGLPEQKNGAGEMFDYARVQAAFLEVATKPPDEIIAALVAEGESWMKGAVQEDDISMLVLKAK
jgi:ligand-binding sensor domain-containing protein/serine phosphatase RsbU (regulator of sigma subunit)